MEQNNVNIEEIAKKQARDEFNRMMAERMANFSKPAIVLVSEPKDSQNSTMVTWAIAIIVVVLLMYMYYNNVARCHCSRCMGRPLYNKLDANLTTFVKTDAEGCIINQQ